MSTAFSPNARDPHSFPEPLAEGPRPWAVPALWPATLAGGQLAEELPVVDTR